MAKTSTTQRPNAEPPVDELLADPLVHLVMQRDGVSEEEILRVLRCVRHARAAYDHIRSIPAARSI